MAAKKTSAANPGDGAPGVGDGAPGVGDGAPGVTETLRVRAQRDGYRRAGRAWSREWTEVEVTSLTKGQLRALADDPRIQVDAASVD